MRYKIFGNNMPALTVELTQGEQMFTQSGAMSWMDSGIVMDTNMRGGIMGGIGRLFSGESLFMATFTCQVPVATVTFASTFMGSLIPYSVGTQTGLICQKNAFLCAQPSVNLDVVFTKRFSAGLFGGEGFILQRLSGSGMAFLEASGDVYERTLLPGETITVDTGHIIAFEETVNYHVETVKGFKNILFGGEGLFLTKLTGPGKIYLQTMTVASIASRIIPYLPTSSS